MRRPRERLTLSAAGMVSMSVSHEWATHTMRIADRAHDIRYRPSTSDEKVINQICQEGRYDLRKSPCWNSDLPVLPTDHIHWETPPYHRRRSQYRGRIMVVLPDVPGSNCDIGRAGRGEFGRSSGERAAATFSHFARRPLVSFGMGIGRFCWGPLGVPNSGYSCRSPRSSTSIHAERYSCPDE